MTMSDQRKNVLGVATLCALLFGGGTAAHLVVDSLLQLIIVASSLFVLTDTRRTRSLSVAIGLGVAATVLCLIQLLPLPIDLARLGRTDIFENARFGLEQISWHSISLAPGRTLDSLFWIASLTIYAMAVTSFEPAERNSLVSYVLVGTLLNVVFALMSYAAISTGKIEFVGYEASAGIFANRNHFGTLVFATMVLMIFYLLRRSMLVGAIAYCILALVTLFATSSQAAAFAGTGVAALGVAMIFSGHRSMRIGLGMLIGLTCLAYFGLAWQVETDETGLDMVRIEAFATTWRAALDNLPFGTGFGSFLRAYKSYELTIFHVQINHAHNDYLELLLEGGGAAAVLLAAFFAYVVRLLMRSRTESLPAIIGLIAILAHSLVDYPLRTYAISILATFLLVLSAESASTTTPTGSARSSTHSRQRNLHPGAKRTRPKQG
ncbi:O-antigen ligase [Notoacmeibacter sp. MSK16QG-6]|uniref:O-antigen ligase family protein n=1 Tax=Notoacmeibacter sp. MSK16QG-6 TaxID=2957982 RepID=UPI00209F89C8|nr:O-antigen ligase family protein [Notoacmeibacter sp. MSK16QG-6]MCP1198395.1 O-antigen ligase family protein [Notoacmeibacter sp. MSK16QG-6]